MRNIYNSALQNIRSGSDLVLATVVHTAGSTPQKAGSSALFGEPGLLAGTVGGGMVEEEVRHIAGSVLISGFSDQFYFNLDSEKDGHGAICGGEARVLVDANPSLHLACFEEMENSLLNRDAGFLLTVAGQKEDRGRDISRYWIKNHTGYDLPNLLDPAFRERVRAHYGKAEKSGFTEIDLLSLPDNQVKLAFLEYIEPMPQLIIAGGGHVGKALAHLGSLLDFEVSIVDDRPEFANREDIPDADHHIVGEFGNILRALKPAADTYIVIVTRGHMQDGEALKACIGSDASYIGMMGSRNKVETMKKQFLAENWASPGQWAAVHTPIGLSIGSRTVQEIAISIAAQLVEVRNRKKTSHG